MDKETFTNKVLSRLPKSYFNARENSLEDILNMKNIIITELYKWNFSIEDAITYCKCFVAINRMRVLRRKYFKS